MKRKIFFLLSLVSVLFFSCGEKNDKTNNLTELCSSPDGKNVISFRLENGKPFYTVERNGESVVKQSVLGFILKDMPALSENFVVEEVTKSTIDETWEQVWGENKVVVNKCNEVAVLLKQNDSLGRMVKVVLRAFDDGVAFRYEFPEQPNLKEFVIMDELTNFTFAEDYTSWWIHADYNSYEKFYQKTPLSELDSVHTPMTMRSAKGLHISIHEAALVDYSSMTLIRGAENLQLKCDLVPWADGSKVKTAAPMKTPWRTIQLSDNAGGLIESSMILNLNEPNKYADVTWITPMKFIGVWWEIHLGNTSWRYSDKNHGATTENVKRYIDFAAENNIGGVLAEGWNTGWEDWGKPKAFDMITPYPDFDIEEVCRYAKEKGVVFIGHHETGGDAQYYEEVMEAAFKRFNELGITSIKTGYAGPIRPDGEFNHGQYMVNHYQKVIDMAAKYHIMINAHEPIKDTGLRRTYPNFMTREGVRGQEWEAWSEGLEPEHPVEVAFTRMLSGPMDYTAAIFDVLYDDSQPIRSGMTSQPHDSLRVHTTVAKQIALFLVLYSPMQMAADIPSNYEGKPEFEFIKRCPVTFDESHVINGEVGDFVTIARKLGDEWFIGSITDEEKRELTMPLTFLDEGKKYVAKIFADAEGTNWRENPENVQIIEQEVDKNSTLTLKLAQGGGQAIIISPIVK